MFQNYEFQNKILHNSVLVEKIIFQRGNLALDTLYGWIVRKRSSQGRLCRMYMFGCDSQEIKI